MIADHLSNELYQTRYLPIIRGDGEGGGGERPFLSVIIRTQGRRPEELREALTCLNAQSDPDFEVLLIGHKLDAEGDKLVSAILGEQAQPFRDKIRFLRLDSGTRATPLNFGFAHARGSYVSFFDDDDLVFENWVEKFHEAAEEHSGAILHAYVVSPKVDDDRYPLWAARGAGDGCL